MRKEFLLAFFLAGSLSSSCFGWDTTSTSPLLLRLGPDIESTYKAGSVLQPELLQIPYPDENAIAVGEGVDLITGRRKLRKCVVYPGSQRTTYNNKETSFSEVTDEESLWRKLNTTISAKASYAGYSGGGNYESTVETKTSSKTITTVAQVTLTTYADAMTTADSNSSSYIKLSQFAYDMARTDPAEFRRICGDGFVVQITYGASLYGILQFSSSTFESKQKTKVGVDASGPGGAFQVKGSSELDEAINTAGTNLKVQSIERGAAAGKIPSTQAGLEESFNTFGTRAHDNERPLYLTVIRYSALQNGNGRRYVEVASGLEAMVKKSLRLKTLLDDLRSAYRSRLEFNDDAVANYNKHDYVFIPNIEEGPRTLSGMLALSGEIMDQIATTNKQIAACIDRSTSKNCMVAELSDVNDLELRAVSPLPLNEIDPTRLEKIFNAARISNPISQQAAACSLARAIQQSRVFRTDQVRCADDNECRAPAELTLASDKVYEGLKFKKQDCAMPAVVIETDKLQ